QQQQQQQQKEDLTELNKVIHNYEMVEKDRQFGDMLRDVNAVNMVLEENIVEQMGDDHDDNRGTNGRDNEMLPHNQNQDRDRDAIVRNNKRGEHSIDLGKLSQDNMSEGKLIRLLSDDILPPSQPQSLSISQVHLLPPRQDEKQPETSGNDERDQQRVIQQINKMERDEKDSHFGALLQDFAVAHDLVEEDVIDEIAEQVNGGEVKQTIA
ncbi:hypothetical protein RFI_08021, partial [Reticulomyxa filosa]